MGNLPGLNWCSRRISEPSTAPPAAASRAPEKITPSLPASEANPKGYRVEVLESVLDLTAEISVNRPLAEVSDVAWGNVGPYV